MKFTITKVQAEPVFEPIDVSIRLETVEEAQEFEARIALYRHQVKAPQSTLYIQTNSVLAGITGLRRALAKHLGRYSINEDMK